MSEQEKHFANYPRKMLRIVVQVKDTPENQVAMRKMVEAVKLIPIPDIQHSVIKAEQVAILIGCVAKPPEETPV